jgi:hypothetical protein
MRFEVGKWSARIADQKGAIALPGRFQAHVVVNPSIRHHGFFGERRVIEVFFAGRGRDLKSPEVEVSGGEEGRERG